MTVSVIIPTYNEKDVLQECLNSLSKQTYKDIEIIVVDDGSTDRTYEVFQKFQIPNSKFQILNGKHKGAGNARNIGAKKAWGKILVFVDADMTFDRNFIKKLVEPIIKDKGLPAGRRGTFSKNENVSNWNNVWARCWNINEGWEDRKRHPKNYPDTQPVFRAILKSEFDRVGGFTSGGYDDDWSLSKKLGYMAVVAPNAVFFHRNPDNLKEIFSHAKWVAKRKYKLGILGYIFALIRSSLPVSILIGLYKGLINRNLRFVIFKIVYDFGIFIGIINYMFTKNGAK